MALPRKSALVACLVSLFGLPVVAQSATPQAPCLPTEKPPVLGAESNPTTRDALVTHSDAGLTGRSVTAQTCLVIGTQEPIQPGQPIGNPPPFGLYLDWALAIVSDGGRFVAVQGTVSKTGPINQSGLASIALPLVLGWNLYPHQPNPSTNHLFTQVAVWPCTDATSTCNPNQLQQREVTKLLGSPDTTRSDYRGAAYDDKTYGPGCLAPARRGDPELRQLTVIPVDNSYFVFACLVSETYHSFKSAAFTVNLLDASNQPAAVSVGGNTRVNIGPLYNALGPLNAQPGPRAPNFVTMLAVQITSVAQVPAVVKSITVGVQYEACEDDNESVKCKQANITNYHYPYKFEYFPPK